MELGISLVFFGEQAGVGLPLPNATEELLSRVFYLMESTKVEKLTD